MNAKKLVWVVAPEPTGRYRSFERRGWPTCWWGRDGKPAAFIECEDAYRPADVALGDHKPLRVVLCHHRHPEAGNSWKRLRMKTSFETLAAAKQAVKDFLALHPEFAPIK